MNYGRPELGERLAADYALGLMPARARRRFEQAMAQSATLAALAAGWSERLAPLDSLSPEETPPARVWQRIEQRIGGGIPAPAPLRARWSAPVVLWRGLVVAAAACAAVALYVALEPQPMTHIAEFADKAGLPHLVNTAKNMPDIGLSTMALGVSERERPRWIRATLLLTNDALPVTAVEPPR